MSYPAFTAEREALEALFDDVERLDAVRAELLKRPIEFPEAALTLPKVREAVVRGAQTGKPFGMVALGVGDAKQHLATVRVAGFAAQGQRRLGAYSEILRSSHTDHFPCSALE